MKDQTHVDTTNQPASELTHISLCAGYGGIDLGLHRVFGQKLRTIAFSEIEAFAVENLLAKMEAGLLPAAPVWTDLRTFPWADFQGVDLLSGGFPCQPFSAAGKRNADSDPRHLFPAIIEGIRHAKPGIVFLENVEGIVSAKLAGDDWRDPAGTSVLLHVLRELERVGYKATAGIFSASEVGAPHQRKRVFILAERNDQRSSLAGFWQQSKVAFTSDNAGEELAYDKSLGIQGRWPSWLQEPRPHAGQALPVRGGDAGGEQWPSRPGEPQHAWDAGRMADTNHQHGHGEERGGNPETQGVPSEHWQEEHSRWQFGRADAEGHQAWPSRPGEQQFAWEPPRVCGGVAHTGSLGRRRGSDGDERRLRGEIQVEGSCGGGAEEAMGNAEQFLLPATREYGAMDEASGISTNGEGGESTQTDPIAGATRKREGDGGNASEFSETEPSLGRDADGPAGGMDYAELCISCDNRTDELRLLGNGVVPATAERAFVTLMQELTK
jgi:DNA (cytosine-5)-methyltransferase 1